MFSKCARDVFWNQGRFQGWLEIKAVFKIFQNPPLISTGDQNQLINSGIWFKKSKEAVNMINLQFDHNKLTYKNCLQFLGLVIVIQIKAMNWSEYGGTTFPSKKCRLFHSQVTTQNTHHEDREILKRNQGLEQIYKHESRGTTLNWF